MTKLSWKIGEKSPLKDDFRSTLIPRESHSSLLAPDLSFRSP